MKNRSFPLLAAVILALLLPGFAGAQNRFPFQVLPGLPVVDPRKYGAIPNDSLDDGPAIQAAVNAARDMGLATQSGGAVLLAPGRWLTSIPIVLPRNGVTPDNCVWIAGVNERACILEGMATFPTNRGVIEWAASTSQVWHGRIAQLNIVAPAVAGTRCIWHKSNRSGGMGAGATINDVMAEWFQCDMENLILEGNNQYNPSLIKFEVGNRLAKMSNIIGDPWRGGVVVPAYNTLLIECAYQYNNTDPAHGEDSVGIGLSTLDHIFPVVRRGGWIRTWEGRMYDTTWDTAFDNGPLPGSGGYGFNFRNSFACSLRNLMSEGGGGQGQFLFYNCRDLRCDNFTVPVGFASGDVAHQTNHAYVTGDRVLPTLIYSPTSVAPANRVYTAQNNGTSAGTEPDWSTAAGAGQTLNDNGITWQASAFPACSNGVELQSCEGVIFDTHYQSPASTTGSFRLVKNVIIDSACRNVKLTNWTLRGNVSGGAFSGATDAANEISIDPAAAANFCFASGEIVQGFNNWRTTYRLGQDQNRPTVTTTLDFPSVAAGGSQTLTVTVTSAAVGDAVQATPPSGYDPRLTIHSYVSSSNTVTVRAGNPSAGAIDPPSGTWRVTVIKP